MYIDEGPDQCAQSVGGVSVLGGSARVDRVGWKICLDFGCWVVRQGILEIEWENRGGKQKDLMQ